MRRLGAKLAWTAIVLAIAIGGGLYVVWRTVQSLTTTNDFAGGVSALWRLVLLGLACGTISFTVVEFFKRLSPLRSWYNELTITRWYNRQLYRDRPSRYPEQGEPGFPKIYWDAPIEQVTAQLSSHMTRTGADQFSGSPDEITARRAVETEAAIDHLQARASAGWVRLLRIVAVVIASLVAGIAALASKGSTPTVVGAFMFGLTIGGPFSWVIRDLARAIESRARY